MPTGATAALRRNAPPRRRSNLALSVAKWQGRAGIPGKPFVIWAIGSSWTACQGDGYALMRAIRQRFPHAPPILYKRHDGSGTPWDYACGWVRQFVAADQPDLIFTYTPGTPEGLDAHADGDPPAHHGRRHRPQPPFRPQSSKMTPDDIENGVAPGPSSAKSAASTRPSSSRIAASWPTISAHGLKPAALLADAVHQNLARMHSHLGQRRPPHRQARPLYLRAGVAGAADCRRPARADDRDRAGRAFPATGPRPTAALAARGRRPAESPLHRQPDRSARPQSARRRYGEVLIDGMPAEQAPVFYTTFIEPKLKVGRGRQRRQPGDMPRTPST